MSLLAPSLAAAFLGCLAFVGWLLWLRRRDERRQFTAEVAKLQGQLRGTDEAASAALGRLEKRLLKLEQKSTGFGPGARDG